MKSLPRCSIQDLLKELRVVEEKSCSNSSNFNLSEQSSWFSDARSPLRKRTCLNKNEKDDDFEATRKTSESSSSENKSGISSSSLRKRDRAINLEKEFFKLATSELRTSNLSSLEKESRIGKESDFLNLGATSSNYEPVLESNRTSNGISNLSGRIEKLGRDIANIDRSVNAHSYQSEKRVSGLSALLKEAKECTAERKEELSGSREKEKRRSLDMAKMVLQRKCRSLSDRGVKVDNLRSRETTQGEVSLPVCKGWGGGG